MKKNVWGKVSKSLKKLAFHVNLFSFCPLSSKIIPPSRPQVEGID